MRKNLKYSIHKLFMNLEKFHYGSILAQKLKNHIFGPFWVPFGLKTSHQKKKVILVSFQAGTNYILPTHERSCT